MSSSLLLFPQCFGRYVRRPSSGVCRTREPSRNFELRPLLKIPEFDEHLKKVGGYIGRNVVEITIKMKTIVRKLLMIKDVLFSVNFSFCDSGQIFCKRGVAFQNLFNDSNSLNTNLYFFKKYSININIFPCRTVFSLPLEDKRDDCTGLCKIRKFFMVGFLKRTYDLTPSGWIDSKLISLLCIYLPIYLSISFCSLSIYHIITYLILFIIISIYI